MEGKAAMTADEEANIDWSLTTWKGSRLQQHREFQSLPLQRKLEIIEEFGALGRAFQVNRKSKSPPRTPEDSGSHSGMAIPEKPESGKTPT
jgi:hypothetical protein